MTNQSEIVGIETKAYSYQCFIYLIHRHRLFQVDHNYFLELMPGNEVYGSMIRRLKKMKPLPESERLEILSKLLNTIEELK